MFRRSALVAFDTASRMELTPMYAAFQMANAMAGGGKIIESAAPSPLEAMAVRADDRLIVTVNNHTAGAVHVPVTVWDIPFDGPITRVVRTIDDLNSRDGNGLQAGTNNEMPSANPLTFPISLGPYATVQVSLLPAGRK